MPVRGKGRRYLKLWIAGDRDHSGGEVFNAIRNTVLSLFGAQGLSRIEPKLMSFDEAAREGVVRCDRAHLREMRAALAMVTRIGDWEAAIFVERASGTLRSLRKP
jgi:ribonuclease P/MRP protein subunit POP5